MPFFWTDEDVGCFLLSANLLQPGQPRKSIRHYLKNHNRLCFYLDDYILFGHLVRMQRTFLGAMGYFGSTPHLLFGRFQNSVGLLIHGCHHGCLDPVFATISSEYLRPISILVAITMFHEGMEASTTSPTKTGTLHCFPHGSSVRIKSLVNVLSGLTNSQCHCSGCNSSGYLHTATNKLVQRSGWHKYCSLRLWKN